MTQTVSDNKQFLEQVVKQLTGGGHGDAYVDLREQVQRAAADIDERTASGFAWALVGSLCEDPSNLPKLEALMIVGLAHPRILDEHRIPLEVEGRRLAILLERDGQITRARSLLEELATRLPDEPAIRKDLDAIMRRTGENRKLAERYMVRAREAIHEGDNVTAIQWLQEILLHDRGRRDVARMIRELRFEESERETRNAKRNRLVIVLFIISMVVTAAGMREYKLYREYDALPPADVENVEVLRLRLGQIDRMLAENRFWLGMLPANREREVLRTQIDAIERNEADRERNEREVQDLRDAEALKYYEDGKTLVLDKRYAEALDLFRKALETASKDWAHRKEVQNNVAAVEDYLEGH